MANARWEIHTAYLTRAANKYRAADVWVKAVLFDVAAGRYDTLTGVSESDHVYVKTDMAKLRKGCEDNAVFRLKDMHCAGSMNYINLDGVEVKCAGRVSKERMDDPRTWGVK